MTNKKRDRDALSDAIGRMIDINKNSVSIAPDWIAKGAMEIIRFDYGVHPAGWYGCYQHMLQMSRERLRGRFDPEERARLYISGQSEMFGDTLQERYPRAPRREPDGEWADPEYVQRDHLTEDDRWHNVDRLRHVSVATARHCDALEAETEHLFGPRKDAA